MLLLLQLNPAHTHPPPHCKWCCYYGYIKCTWQTWLSDFRSPDPPHSSVTALPVVPGGGGTKACQWRLYIILGLAPCCSWQGTSTAPGIFSHHFRVALIYSWLLWSSKGCPSQGTRRFLYFLAISHGFHPKPSLGQRSKYCCAYAWYILRSQLYRRLESLWQTKYLFEMWINQ